jgi:arginyl-tRNA--protein-N-Asp/Glu arginylyltransferase
MKYFADPHEKRFFATPRMPCPYLPDRMERKVFTDLSGEDADSLHDALAVAGFRRSQNIIYRPLCDGCASCVPVRVRAREFHADRWARRIENRNADLRVTRCPPSATTEQYQLFRAYLSKRHADGGMMGMDFAEYQAMVEDTPVTTVMFEFREPDSTLVAACLTDILGDGLSMVYSFYHPDLERRSLGSAAILWHIRHAADGGLPFVYLGYWIEESRKMSYKTRFTPIEALRPDGWQLLPTE